MISRRFLRTNRFLNFSKIGGKFANKTPLEIFTFNSQNVLKNFSISTEELTPKTNSANLFQQNPIYLFGICSLKRRKHCGPQILRLLFFSRPLLYSLLTTNGQADKCFDSAKFDCFFKSREIVVFDPCCCFEFVYISEFVCRVCV